jgi:hypothetical protein
LPITYYTARGIVLLHLNFFAGRAEFVALAILPPVVWLQLCCPVALTIGFRRRRLSRFSRLHRARALK